MKSEQIKHSLSVGIKSIQSRVYDRETDEVISFVKIPIMDSGLVRCEKGTKEINANELADKLSDKTMRDYILFEYLPEIVSMLRKQQESIEGLNRDYDLLFAEHQLLLKQEPVAVRYDYDGYGYQYIDSGSGSDWQTRVQGEPLYTAPQIKVGCAECGVNGNHALYCVKCAEKYLKEKNT